MGPLKEKLSHKPQIKWKCPPKFVLSSNWHVAAGEESKETETQKYREMSVLEAFYPGLSDISPGSSLLLGRQEDHINDDSYIPLIPIEEGAVDLPSDMAAPQSASFDSQSLALPQGLLSGNPNAPHGDPPASLKPSANEKSALEVLPGFQADVVAAATAAAAAITAIMESKEQVSLIDPHLLIKFLSDPRMIEKLISEQGAPASTKTEPVSGPKPLTAPAPLPGTKPGLVEEVINEDGAGLKTGSTSISVSNLVTPSVAIPCPKPDPVIKKLVNEQGAAANISGSKLVRPSVALPSPKPDPAIKILVHKHTVPTDTVGNFGAAPVSGSKPATSRFAFPSRRPDPVVNKSTYEHGVRTNAGGAPFSVGKPATLLASLPSSKPDLVEIKRMINEYGKLDGTENEPVSRSMLSTLQVPMLSTKPDVALPAWMNSHPLPNAGETGIQLKAFSPDDATAISPFSAMTAPLLAPLSVDAARLNLHPLPNVVQPNLRMKGVSSDGVPMFSNSAVPAPPAKDINYIKNLIKQHGEMQEIQDYSNLTQSGKFLVHSQDLKQVPTLKPSELTLMKVQKPCIFFNGPKGCRNGSNCLFVHDKAKNSHPGSVLEVPGAKKMKLGGEIAGRT